MKVLQSNQFVHLSEIKFLDFRVFSLDVTAAILVFLNNESAAMLVSPTNPPGIELYYHANVFFVSLEKHSNSLFFGFIEPRILA